MSIEGNATGFNDTIRIDGKLVIVEQVETEHIDPILEPDLPNDRIDFKPKTYFQLIASPFVSRVGMKKKRGEGLAVVDDRSTVNEFLNKNFENTMGAGINAELGLILNDRVSIISGISYNFTNYKSRYFTELDLLDQDEAMYDEFIGFYIDADGNLFQQVRFQIDDLAFKDSLVGINISSSLMRSHEFTVPFLVEFKSIRNNNNKIHFSGAIGPMIRFNLYNGELKTVLLSENGDFNEFTLNSSEFRKIYPLIHFRGGVQYRLKETISLIAHFQGSFSLLSADKDHENIEVYQQEMGIGLGVRWYLSNK